MQRWLRPWPGRLRNPDETTSEVVGPLLIQRSFRASRSRSTPRTLSPTGPPGDLPLEAVVSGRPQGPTGQRWPAALAAPSAGGSVLAGFGTFLAAVVPVSVALPKMRLARPGTPDRARRVAGGPARSVRTPGYASASRLMSVATTRSPRSPFAGCTTECAVPAGAGEYLDDEVGLDAGVRLPFRPPLPSGNRPLPSCGHSVAVAVYSWSRMEWVMESLHGPPR